MKSLAILLVPSAFLLASCATPPADTKTITANPRGYLETNFQESSITPAVRDAILAKDARPGLPGRITIESATHVEILTGTSKSFDATNVLVHEPVRGGFMRTFETDLTNGLPTSYHYGVSYRNLYTVYSQSVDLTKTTANYTISVTSVPTFVSVGDAVERGMPFEASFNAKVNRQNAVPYTVALNCTMVGPRYPASEINADIQGEAQDMNCTLKNYQGVDSDTSVRAYLFNYGLVLIKQRATASYTTTFKTTSFKVN